jgi:hypothetical protein
MVYVLSFAFRTPCFEFGICSAYDANALRGGGRRLSVRAVKAAGLAFIGAKRRALTEGADGSGAGFGQEGHTNGFLTRSSKENARRTNLLSVSVHA